MSSLPVRSRALAEPANPEPLKRSEEVQELVASFTDLIVPFIHAADSDASTKSQGHGNALYDSGAPRTTLVEPHPPEKLSLLLHLSISPSGSGKEGLLQTVSRILRCSVNTWDQGFLDKLYGSTNPLGLASELLLGALNTNVHVYATSPALTLIEKHVTSFLAKTFGYEGEFAGGINQPGGSASNSSALVVARNTLFPETKDEGLGGRKFVIFTSEHGHYSIEKAAQIGGYGSKSVRAIKVDRRGRMIPGALDDAICKAKEDGETPLFVNATAGTTVLGSFDPFDEIADVCTKHGVWLHVDGSWGGSVVFNDALKRSRLRGIGRADSIAVTPHKMLQVPMTCSFLLVQDLRKLHQAMTLPAGYLFHASSTSSITDLADLTPQCGRRGDALKFYLSLHYYGLTYWSDFIAHARSITLRFHQRLKQHADIILVGRENTAADPGSQVCESTAQSQPANDEGAIKTGQEPTDEEAEEVPELFQICFYHVPKRRLHESAEKNSARTEKMASALVRRGFMVDYAPGEHGKFFRVVIHGETRWETVEGLMKALDAVGEEVGV